MRILLLAAPFQTEHGIFSRASRSPAVTRSGTVYYPIWLCYAAGALEQAGHTIKIIDACANQYDRKTTLSHAKSFQPEFIVVDTTTPSIYNDVEVAALLKDILPEAFVILVGTHASALPEETLKLNSRIDGIARKEYDYTVCELADVLQTSGRTSEARTSAFASVKGLSYVSAGQVVHNPDRPFIENLDELPFVSSVYKKHLDIRKYFFSAAEYPMVMIMTGRGCPANCFYCVYPQVLHGRKYRHRSIENIVSEIEYVITTLPEVKSIGIEDDTFTLSKKRVRELCRQVIDKGFARKIHWWVNARVDTLDLETMRLMRKAGCRLVIPGYESGCQQILDNMKKEITLEQSIRFTWNCKKAGLLVHGCFMAGNPGETRETMEQTLDFAKQLPLDTAQFYPLIVYPGTEAFQWARKEGCLRPLKYNQWLTPGGQHNAVIASKNVSADDIIRFCTRARREFYLRPRYLLYKLKQCLSSLHEFRRTFKSLATFYRHLIHDAVKPASMQHK